MFSANGARSFEPGATPQGLMHLKSQALKAQFIAVQPHRKFNDKHPAP
jgi:hypothetical protein